jgi:hypothetical protein
MPANKNGWVIDLLGWHGHDRGGVRVPFVEWGNPIGSRVSTSLIGKLGALASEISTGESDAPRWIFLIGGPGNGKSEAVQHFVERLDLGLGCADSLNAAVRKAFANRRPLPRRIDVTGEHLKDASERFHARVKKLILIQDASASDHPEADAAKELVDDVADLLTSSESELPVFVCSANRGLLSRALARAHEEYPGSSVVRALEEIARATALGLEALSGTQPACWPLETDRRFACWPLDVESLVAVNGDKVPMRELLERATVLDSWEVEKRCYDCDSRDFCPIRRNAELLRDRSISDHLLRILRRGELATGQRWSFRDAFSLTAELIVGQWSDYNPSSHPCDWVHDLVFKFQNARDDAERAKAVIPLARALFPQRLFQTLVPEEELREVRKTASNLGATTTGVICDVVRRTEPDSSKHIRMALKGIHQLRIDPARWCGESPNDLLKHIEDEFGQSVRQGLDEFRGQLVEPELSVLDMFARAEAEWDVLGRDKEGALAAIEFLRRAASTIAKRAIGVRAGSHANESLLRDYEDSLRDQKRLSRVRELVAELLGVYQFAGSLGSCFGQAEGRMTQSIVIVGPKSGIRPRPAPVAAPDRPAYDMPCIQVGDSFLPLTFELYVALRRRQDGCANGSLPAGVVAMLDRLRHSYSARLARDNDKLTNGQAWVEFRALDREIAKLGLDYGGEVEVRLADADLDAV